MATKQTKRSTSNKGALPALKKGEKYIGAIVGADGNGHHVILLAGDESKNWKDGLAWAKALGGDLPDRVEQALLYRDHKGEFQRDYYWSNTQCAGLVAVAWIQGFGNGIQFYCLKGYVYRCRAVRRVPVQ